MRLPARGWRRPAPAAGGTWRSRTGVPALPTATKSIPVHFAIEGETGGLRARPVRHRAGRDRRTRRSKASRCRATAWCAAPTARIFVFEHVTAERFEPRAVRVEPLDGERVLVSAGHRARASASSCRAPSSSIRCAEERRRCSRSSSRNRCATACWCWRSRPVLVVFGAFTAPRLPVDVFPDLNRPTVTIMTEAEGSRRRRSSSSSPFRSRPR